MVRFAQPEPHAVANSRALADTDRHAEGEERGRGKLLQPLSLPKNRSTGNLAVSSDLIDRSRIRMSFDASSASPLDLDSATRYRTVPRPSPAASLPRHMLLAIEET